MTAASTADEPARVPDPDKIKVGIIGLDSSHCIAFTDVINAPDKKGDLAALEVVAAYPGGSPDLPASRDRVEGYTKQMRDKGIRIVDSIDKLLPLVDAVLIESVDGRPHLEQARAVFAARKPVFIDKPLAGSLADGIKIFKLAKEHNVPCFSSSSLRFSPGIAGASSNERIGKVVGCDAYGPCTIGPHHPDLYWYGIHGIEALYTIMGPGCKTVSRTQTDDAELVVGVWPEGRIGTYRGIRAGKTDFGALVFGEKQIVPAGTYAGYKPLVEEIAKFLRTGNPPVSAEETLELFAFMEAADESKRQGGKPVTLESIVEKARKE